MRDRFADRAPYSGWVPEVLGDYCTHGLLPVGDGYELACPPALEASMYQNALRTDPYRWLGDLGAPATLYRKSVVLVKRMTVRVDIGGRITINIKLQILYCF